jgi:hypothetical protein
VALAGPIDVAGDRVAAVWWVLNPEKLRWISRGWVSAGRDREAAHRDEERRGRRGPAACS